MAELKWLEDLLTLMDEDSFTKAAERRFVTQPAFSRRIRLLENWLGVTLVDRKHKPVIILPHVREHETAIRELVNRFYQLRNDLQDKARFKRSVFVVQHSLAISHFPPLIKRIKPALPESAYRLYTANNEDCAALFMKGARFLLCYELAEKPVLADHDYFLRKTLAHEQLIPVVDKEWYDVLLKDGFAEKSMTIPLHLLLFTSGSFLAEALEKRCLPQVLRDYRVEVVCESGLAISLKQMVLAGMGIAWLPTALVQQELEEGRLVSLVESLGCFDLDICLYYKRDSGANEAFQLA